uniref:DNA topoisomerase 1 n=1 Tax=candidate division WOR-3 bacterium TaxID=2052148 RepID=A0A7V3PTK3_UNCW3
MSTKKDLLIVESPTKAHTITRLLKGKMRVLSSRGHIADLPKSRLGVDIENGFEPQYIRIRGKAPVINELKTAARQAKLIYLGTDPDREGEAIAYSVAQEIKNGAPIKRVLFYEITPKGISAAFNSPGEIDQRKVDAHRARRVLDRLVGYLVSPLLWRTVRAGKSAGRVQTVALRILVEREREIQKFVPQEYWLVRAIFHTVNQQPFEARLIKIDGADAKITSAEEMERVRAGCQAADFVVAKITIREKHKKPLPPFITATLLKEAGQVLGFNSRRTMQIAQQLFEGVELEKEAVGLITYPRTDSFRIADDIIENTRKLLAEKYGERFVPEKPRRYPDRKGTQGAHEAIRPTRIELTPEQIKKYLTPEQFKLYNLIYNRFLASQMADAIYQQTEVLLAGGKFIFRAEAIQRLFAGFEQVYGEPEKVSTLPPLHEKEPVKLIEFIPEQKWTQPPPRYTEANLIKRLEINGIGRPSTYATIVPTLLERKYVVRTQGKLVPTELGIVVYDILIPRFANIFEIGFTRQMEEQLDLIEEGAENWRSVVARFYQPFKQDLDQALAESSNIREDLARQLEEKCPKCGKPLMERWGKFGKFIACSGYPECDYVQKPESKTVAEQCPKCGKPLVERKGRFGTFIACSGYPECDYIKREPKPPPRLLDEKCPKCGKPLVERKGRFGTFIACSGYPECRYIKKVKKQKPVKKEEEK